jgi:hypothetical protein
VLRRCRTEFPMFVQSAPWVALPFRWVDCLW